MRKSLQLQILVSVMAMSIIGLPANVQAADLKGDSSNNYHVVINENDTYGNVYGIYDRENSVSGGSATMNGGTVNVSIYGGRTNATDGIAEGNTVEMSGGKVAHNVYGGYSNEGNAVSNNATVSGGNITQDVFGGYADLLAEGNTVKINNGTVVGNNVCGGESYSGDAVGNHAIINGGNITQDVFGGRANSSGVAEDNTVEMSGGKVAHNVYGGYSHSGSTKGNTLTISNGEVVKSIYGGCGDVDTENNTVKMSGGTVGSYVYGGYSYKGDVIGNNVIISGGNITGQVYGGYTRSANGEANNNSVTLSGTADVSQAVLYGTNKNISICTDNVLKIDGWSGTVKSINNFNNINFDNLIFNSGENAIMNLTNRANLSSTNIKVYFAGGQDFVKDSSMNLIKNAEGYKGSEVNSEITSTAGVAQTVTGEITNTTDNNVVLTSKDVKLNNQTMLVAENRAVAAAFVNQGTDLINDSLDVLSRDGKYGIKTFAAVHGNRSKYDVNSDLKINGWSSIVGVGNEKNIGNGDFSWGVFYENGSGNYRTYNEFNNEFFRGDGSLVYNGGGIAARFEQDNGVYTEGSLRAGMLKSEMTNALKDGAGNSYGYKSESTYYGAHIGVGKIISLNEATDLDVYGKFFHTYTDGDSFAVAGDKFEFDSITSDRLRIGARLTTNKENKFSTYYGLAYEYEFNGDADMRAQNMSAPEQSLKGSSCMAEIGMNYKPSSESPWSFDLSMRGYAGQRDGFSGNVQATYTF